MGIGDTISGIFGSENEFKAEAHKVDSNAYEYGGRPGGADEAAGRAAGLQHGWNGRSDSFMNQQQQGMNRGNASLDASAGARQAQVNAANLMMNRATGATPSIAQMQGDRAMGQAVASQASAASSARGPAALALAQQGAANNTANAQSQIAGQTQIAAAQERQAAEQAAFGAYSQMRGGDQGDAGLSFNSAAQAGQLGLGAGQLAQGYGQQEQNVRNSQLSAQMNKQSQESANANAAQGINAGVAAQNAGTDQQNGMAAIGAAGDTAGAAVSAVSDERAKTNITSPADFVPSTWGTTQASPAAVASAGEAIQAYDDAQKAVGSIPNRLDASADERATAAGQGFMLGQQVGAALYDGKAGGMPDSVAAGMKSTGVNVAKGADKGSGGEAKGGDAAKGEAGKGDGKGGKPGAGSVLSGIGSHFNKLAASVQPTYSGGSGYVPPQLLAVSDVRAKQPYEFQQTGVNPGAGPAEASFDVLDASGGLNTKATYKKHSAFATRFGTNPAAGTMMTSDVTGKTGLMLSDVTGKQGLMLSDVVGKLKLSDARAKDPVGVLPYEDNVRVGQDGRGYLEEQSESIVPQKFARMQAEGESRSAEAPKAKAKEPKKAGGKGVDYDALERWAKEQTGGYRARTEQIRSGEARPDVDPMADAARSMQASAYAYKPEMTPPEQKPGEPNVGPMAQNMAADPVAGTAIKRNPENGLLMIDQPKMLKVLGGVVASQQQQLDELRRKRGG